MTSTRRTADLDCCGADVGGNPGAMATPKLFRNLQLFDPRWEEPRGGYEVLVEGDKWVATNRK